MAIFDEAERMVLRLLRPLRLRVNNMVRRAVVKAYNDAKKQGEIQVSVLKEPDDNFEYFQHYGLASSPPVGSGAIVLRIGGSGNNTIVIATELRENRPKLATEGDVKLWDKDGQAVALLRDIFSDLPGSGLGIGLFGTTVLLGGSGTSTEYSGKGVARLGDSVDVTVPIGAFTDSNGDTSPTVVVTLSGTISSASGSVAAVD